MQGLPQVWGTRWGLSPGSSQTELMGQRWRREAGSPRGGRAGVCGSVAPKSFLLCRALQVTLACDSIRESASLSPESPWLQLEMRWKSCWARGEADTPPSSSWTLVSLLFSTLDLLHSTCVPQQGGGASCSLGARKARLGSGDSQGDHEPR